MKPGLLKSLLGKLICKDKKIPYCHVDKILAIVDNMAIATVIIQAFNGKYFYWFVELEWETNYMGLHDITKYNIIKECELNGYESSPA